MGCGNSSSIDDRIVETHGTKYDKQKEV